MDLCANSCRARPQATRAARLVPGWCAILVFACGPELGDSHGDGVASPAYAACLAALERDYAGARYDSGLILACSEPQCGGAEPGAADALLDANGHALRQSFLSLSMLVVDVGRPEDVLPWACRYTLDPAYAGAFGEAFPNLALDLR